MSTRDINYSTTSIDGDWNMDRDSDNARDAATPDTLIHICCDECYTLHIMEDTAQALATQDIYKQCPACGSSNIREVVYCTYCNAWADAKVKRDWVGESQIIKSCCADCKLYTQNAGQRRDVHDWGN